MSKPSIILHLFFLVFMGCHSSKAIQNSDTDKNYLFFIHNQFLEENLDGTFSDKYNVNVDYEGILQSFKKEGFIVLSEKRTKNTDTKKYAKKIVSQIDSLIKTGVQPNHITIVGTSKGGYIAQYVSTMIENPDLNFVFIGCYQESDIENYPEINFCGNILTIYEKTDAFGVSAIKRKETSKLKINQFKEIELNTGLKHGFLYVASEEWIKPCKMWANRNYDFINLRQELEKIIAQKNASIGVSIKNIEDGDTLNINGNQNSPLMSVFKFHIALATLDLVDKGKLSLKQEIFVKKEELHENTWSPIRDSFPNGNMYLTLDQLLRFTVSHSDNNGCDILLELIGGTEIVQEFIHKQGIEDFVIKVNEQEMRTWENLYINTSTPVATTQLLEKFYKKEVLEEKSTKYLYELMVECSRGITWMKAGLPEGTELAHRTGLSNTNENNLRVAMNDVGIVKLPNGKHLIISIYLKDITETRENTEKIIADLTKTIWNYYTWK
jgi:beta-lactamase class A